MLPPVLGNRSKRNTLGTDSAGGVTAIYGLPHKERKTLKRVKETSEGAGGLAWGEDICRDRQREMCAWRGLMWFWLNNGRQHVLSQWLCTSRSRHGLLLPYHINGCVCACMWLCMCMHVGPRRVFYGQKEMRHRLILSPDGARSTFKTHYFCTLSLSLQCLSLILLTQPQLVLNVINLTSLPLLYLSRLHRFAPGLFLFLHFCPLL